MAKQTWKGFAASTLILAGCGEGPGSATPSSTHAPDRTEVKVETTSFDDGGRSGPPEATTSTPKPSTSGSAGSEGPDPSEDPMIGGPQEPSVEKAVAPVRPRLRACYKKALAVEPNLGGSATFDVTIGKEGHVSSARFVKRDGLNDDMVGCLLATIKAMTFEVGKKSQIVPLAFGKAPPSTKGSATATPPTGTGGAALDSDAGPRR